MMGATRAVGALLNHPHPQRSVGSAGSPHPSPTRRVWERGFRTAAPRSAMGGEGGSAVALCRLGAPAETG
jgi:hypothetical protein